MIALEKTVSKKLLLNTLRVKDTLIIKTQNSQYQFKITDPINYKGILSGGQIGSKGCKAALLFSTENSLGTVTNTSIKTNAKALFLIELNSKLTHLCTSPIINLKLIRDIDSWKNVLEKTL